MEPFLSYKEKLLRKFTSFAIIGFMVGLAMTAVFAVIVYRMVMVGILHDTDSPSIRKNAKLITTCMIVCLLLLTYCVITSIGSSSNNTCYTAHFLANDHFVPSLFLHSTYCANPMTTTA